MEFVLNLLCEDHTLEKLFFDCYFYLMLLNTGAMLFFPSGNMPSETLQAVKVLGRHRVTWTWPVTPPVQARLRTSEAFLDSEKR